MFVSSDLSSVIVDIGTETFKIGYSDKEYPMHYNSSKTFKNDFTSPVQSSTIHNIDSYISLMTSHLPLDTSYLLISENTFEDENIKERILSEVMEKSLASSLMFSKSSILDTFSYGKTTSINIVISGGSTQIVSVVDGYITCRKKIEYGCEDISKKYLEKINKEKIKQKFDSINKNGCINDNNTNEGLLNFKKLEYARFKKEDFYKKENNIQQFLYLHDKILKITDYLEDILQSNSPDRKFDLLNNILISGGGSLIPNITNLLEKNISEKISKNNFCIFNQPSLFHTFFGGAVMGNIGSFKALNIGKADYIECGVNILKRKNYSWVLNKP
ncbi:actin-related protein [Vairimorpha necatrix]|uniref:Actin-related protein n=1 Tax=Vairimorpha necatrix TaxID=6039 RepID=A0AAX4JGQ6_9MICR